MNGYWRFQYASCIRLLPLRHCETPKSKLRHCPRPISTRHRRPSAYLAMSLPMSLGGARLVHVRFEFPAATMSALVHQVALVSESNRVKLPDLMRVSAALQKQASRDLAPIWEISATVDAFASLEDKLNSRRALVLRFRYHKLDGYWQATACPPRAAHKTATYRSLVRPPAALMPLAGIILI